MLVELEFSFVLDLLLKQVGEAHKIKRFLFLGEILSTEVFLSVGILNKVLR